MRKILQQQLEKVEYADISDLSLDRSFIVPKRFKTNLEIGQEYIIELSDDLLVKGSNEILEYNYNKGKVPPCKYLHGEAESALGKLLFFTGCGYDNGDLPSYWRGYLPKDKVKIVKKI